MPSKKPTAGIILAAGTSTRFGQTKQLFMLKNKCLIEWVLDAALKSRLKQVILVLGHDHQKILWELRPKIQNPRLQVVVNHRYREGQSRSLQAGFIKVKDTFPSVMFLLGDQPAVDSNTIDHLLIRFWGSERDICVPVYRGKRGNPTLFSRKYYKHLLDLTGDIGARQLIIRYSDHVLEVEVENPLCFFDIDTEKDLKTIESFLHLL